MSSADDIFTSRHHAMDYFTVDGVKLRTGYGHERDWYLLPIRELLDNAVDFVTKHYRGSDKCYVKVWISNDDKVFRIKIANSNHSNIAVFKDLEMIFDYDMRYGSKQDVDVISRGMLGDALKQILSLGYVLLHLHDDGNSFDDKQWKHPLVIRHNKRERIVHLRIDKANQVASARIEESQKEVKRTDTELEICLPSPNAVGAFLPKQDIVRFCRKYPIFTTDVSFEFSIVDDSTPPPSSEMQEVYGLDKSKEILAKTLAAEPLHGISKIVYPAIHPIGKERWTNSNSVHTYRPEEFKNRIVNVYSKDTITPYDVLRTYKEGSSIPKTDETSVTIAQLLVDPDRLKKIKKWYKQLKKAAPPPQELSLPYNIRNKKDRADALVSRVARVYDINVNPNDGMRAAYRAVRGFYRDDKARRVWIDNCSSASRLELGKGVIQFPFVFEILAVPLKNPKEDVTQFMGAVNYSVSPLQNTFQGEYRWDDDEHGGWATAEDIIGILSEYGFHRKNARTSRVPCIVVANLVTPRRDPHGYDKSRIDTQPFTQTIAEAVKKIAADIPTFRAAGYVVTSASGSDYSSLRRHTSNREVSAKYLLREFLIKERGLPSSSRSY